MINKTVKVKIDMRDEQILVQQVNEQWFLSAVGFPRACLKREALEGFCQLVHSFTSNEFDFVFVPRECSEDASALAIGRLPHFAYFGYYVDRYFWGGPISVEGIVSIANEIRSALSEATEGGTL